MASASGEFLDLHHSNSPSNSSFEDTDVGNGPIEENIGNEQFSVRKPVTFDENELQWQSASGLSSRFASRSSSGYASPISKSSDNSTPGRKEIEGMTIELEKAFADLRNFYRESCESLRSISDMNIYLDSGNGSSDNWDDETSPITEPQHSTSSQLKIPLSIVKIDTKKVDKAIDKKRKTKIAKNNEERIAFMVDTNNFNLEQCRAQRKRGKQTRGARQEVEQEVEKLIAKFKLKQFTKQMSGEYDEVGDNVQHSEDSDRIIFLYRSDSEAQEIFALTVGASRSVVIDWADTHFPFFVASAILDKKSVTEIAVTNLDDNQYSTVRKMKVGVPLNDTSDRRQLYAPKVCTKFNGNSSNAELKRILGQSDVMKMQVRQESISFPSGATDLHECSKLCELLSAISRSLSLPRSKEFDCFLSKVSRDRNDVLENWLHNSLVQFSQLNSSTENPDLFGKLKNFAIIVDSSSDQFNSNNFEVSKNNTVLRKFSKFLKLEDFYSTDKQFLKSFDDLFVSIKPPHGEHRVKKQFFNCLEGIFNDEKTKNNYWRVGGDWYEVSIKYVIQMSMQYHRVIRESLVDKALGRLYKKWPLNPKRIFPIKGKMAEKRFQRQVESYRKHRYLEERINNNLYEKEPSLIITDSRVIPYDIEICDLFEHVSGPNGKSINLYHVKKVFDADGYRIATCQIAAAATLLHNDLKRDSDDSSVWKLYQFVKDKLPDIDKCKDFEEFRSILKKATFVLAPIFASGERELDTHYAFRTKYDFGDIAKDINPRFWEELKTELHSFLSNNEFIHPSDDEYEFTEKWYAACAVPKDKGFDAYLKSFPSKRVSNLKPQALRKILKRQYYQLGPTDQILILLLVVLLVFAGLSFFDCSQNQIYQLW